VAARDQTPQWIFGYFKFAEGLAEYRQDHFDNAISIMKAQAGSVMGPAPRLIIAMAQYRKGETDEARKTLAAAMVRFDWSPRHADRRDHFIMHILRREAEAMILPDLPAFLEGKHQPRDNIERLSLLGVCRFKNLNLVSARLYADIFAADAGLVDEPGIGHRYNAACVAALAGSGIGEDAAELTEPQRTEWRRQARLWLEEELNSLTKSSGDSSISAGAAVKKVLAEWQVNPNLAGIRDADALGNLSVVEREDCAALWNKIAALTTSAQATK